MPNIEHLDYHHKRLDIEKKMLWLIAGAFLPAYALTFYATLQIESFYSKLFLLIALTCCLILNYFVIWKAILSIKQAQKQNALDRAEPSLQ